jgi:hypothetical protein
LEGDFCFVFVLLCFILVLLLFLCALYSMISLWNTIEYGSRRILLRYEYIKVKYDSKCFLLVILPSFITRKPTITLHKH